MIQKDGVKSLRAKNIKICDFGLATNEDAASYLYRRCGTPGYVAPEIVASNNEDSHFRVTPKCDTFSAGVLLHLLLSRPGLTQPGILLSSHRT